MASHPAADPELFALHLVANPEWVAPACLVAKRGREIVGLLVGRIEAKRLEFRVGYIPLCRVHGRVLAVVDRGVYGAENAKVAKGFVRAIERLLSEGMADFAHFSSLSSSSPIREAASRLPAWYCREINCALEPRWYLAIPATYNEFLATRSKNTRGNLARHEKFLLSAKPEIRVVNYEPGNENALNALEAVMRVCRLTYQYRLGLSPLCLPGAKQVWESCCRLGRLALALVWVGERPVAFAYAQLYKGIALFMTPGYDPEFARFHVGEYATVRLIALLIKRQNVRVLDYGLGYAQYKQTLGTGCQMEGHVRIFASSWKGIVVNSLRTITTLGSGVLLQSAEKLGVRGVLRRLLRSRA